MTTIVFVVLALIILKTSSEVLLERLNERSIDSNRATVPSLFKEMITLETYQQSIDYSLTKGRFSRIESIYGALILSFVLLCGLLPWLMDQFRATWGDGVWSVSASLMISLFLVSLPGWPLAWYQQFRIEERFGFNKMTPRLWWMDRLKGCLLGVILGWPILALLCWLVAKSASFWWFWGWLAITLIQLVLMVLAPAVIMPLFNKFEALAAGPLRARLMALADRSHFRAKTIEVMDGSRRSSHSNAFFTGLGKFRKIVLFDTLLEQLSDDELEAVVAHEIGHYRRKHIPKLIAWSSVTLLLSLYTIYKLSEIEAFTSAFGFVPGDLYSAFLLFMLLGGVVTHWLTPLENLWSRKFEYEADAFAKQAVGGHEALIMALKKLAEKNLSNLTPHPWYSAFYYSHPTIAERSQALQSFPESK